MKFPHLRKTLAALLSPFATRTRRMAIGTTFLTLAAAQPSVQGSESSFQHSVVVPEPEVRKYSSKYVLRHSPRLGAFIQLISHASHASHASHSSHYSGSTGTHYSHYSSSSPPNPTPAAVPRPQPAVSEPKVRTEAEIPVTSTFWTDGLAVHPSSLDHKVEVERNSATITITTRAGVVGEHFNGLYSTASYDFSKYAASILALQAPQDGAKTRFAIVADGDNWYGMSVVGTKLILEKHVGGIGSAKSVPYDPSLHKYWRLRKSDVTPLFLWETSADGSRWTIQQAEPPAIKLTAVRISLSAGTDASVKNPGMAIFTDFHLKAVGE